MGEALQGLSETWDAVTEDFLAGRPTNVRPPLDRYCASYRKQDDLQLDGFCEPFLGPLDRKPKMAFLSLNPGERLKAWQQLDWNDGQGGVFVNELRDAGSYTKWAAGWSYLQPHWQEFIATRPGANHHWSRYEFMKAWYDDDLLEPQDRVDFELYPWHSHTFNGAALKLDLQLLRQFVWDPLAELEAPIVFAFGAWWWENLENLGVEVVARLGYKGDRPFDIGYKPGSRQGLTLGVAPHGGLIVAEKHGGPPPGPPSLSLVSSFKEQVLDALPIEVRNSLRT